MIHHANDCKWWSKQEANNCDCARQEFINLYKKVEELQEMIKAVKDSHGMKTYIFDASYYDQGKGVRYTGKIAIKAYNLEEAERRFKDNRWELTSEPRNLYPTGKDCTYNIEYGEVNEQS